MKTITKNQLMEINAEFLATPYLADQFIEELELVCFSEVPIDKFDEMLQLARQFREYAIGISELKKKRLQSKSRESGRRIRKKSEYYGEASRKNPNNTR